MDNSSFNNAAVQAVWNKAKIIAGNDPNKFRQDYAGAWISRDKYGASNNEPDLSFSWEIDHQKPLCKGGSDRLDNLVPLQWKNNRAKADNYPTWQTTVSAVGDTNGYLGKQWSVEV